MKKITFFITLCLFFLFNTTLFASADSSITTGYTRDGIFYQAVTIECLHSIDPLADADTITLTQEVTFSGIVIPNETIYWREILDETVYTGTLRLYSYYHYDGTTIAIYKGTLYAEYSLTR